VVFPVCRVGLPGSEVLTASLGLGPERSPPNELRDGNADFGGAVLLRENAPH